MQYSLEPLLKLWYPGLIKLPRVIKLGGLVLILYLIIQMLFQVLRFFVWLTVTVFNFLKPIFFILSKNKYYIFMLQCSNNFILDRVAPLRSFILSKLSSLASYAGTIKIFLT